MNQPIPRRAVGSAARSFSACPSIPPRRNSSVHGVVNLTPSASAGFQTTQSLRQFLHGLIPDYGDATVQAFVHRVFSDDSLVQAYFHSRVVTGMESTGKEVLSARTRQCIPLEAASRAADQAQAMSLIRPHERRLTHLAAFLYPCALFHWSRAAALSAHVGLTPSLEQLSTLRALLLEEPMRWLRARRHGLADTLAAAIGMPQGGDIDEEQVARIASAVYLANLTVSARWADCKE